VGGNFASTAADTPGNTSGSCGSASPPATGGPEPPDEG
jgi:hypothetical protein